MLRSCGRMRSSLRAIVRYSRGAIHWTRTRAAAIMVAGTTRASRGLVLCRRLADILAELAHHLDDGAYQVEVLEADIFFPPLLVIDRSRWPATPLSAAIQRFVDSVLWEHWFAYFRGGLFGEAVFGLGASGLIAPSS